MPSRILREGITDSEAINSLTAEQERLFIRLVVAVDDFGRLDARPAVVRARCFPVLEFSTEQVAGWMAALCSTHPRPLMDFYVEDGKLYLQLRGVAKARAEKSKCTDPTGFCIPLRSAEIIDPSSVHNRIQAHIEDDGRIRTITPVPYSGSYPGSLSNAVIDPLSGKVPPDAVGHKSVEQEPGAPPTVVTSPADGKQGGLFTEPDTKPDGGKKPRKDPKPKAEPKFPDWNGICRRVHEHGKQVLLAPNLKFNSHTADLISDAMTALGSERAILDVLTKCGANTWIRQNRPFTWMLGPEGIDFATRGTDDRSKGTNYLDPLATYPSGGDEYHPPTPEGFDP